MSNHPTLRTLAAVAAVMSAVGAIPCAADPLKPYDLALPAEAKSAELCHAQPNRVFVRVEQASECVAYFVTKGHETSRSAVIFFDGDVSLEKYQDQKALAKGTEGRRKFLQQWADKMGRRYIDVSRLGVNGSSGNHGARRAPREVVIMNEAVNLLKVRLGLDTIALAGQSGGSTIAATLLTFGRSDVTCAALGSGAYEIVDLEAKFRERKGVKVDRGQLAKSIYDPSGHVAGIAKNGSRRIFVLGDQRDSKTPYDQQERFTSAIREAGHHARIFPIDARGETDHDASKMTIPVAGACARGDSDEKIYRAIPKPKAKVASADARRSE